MAQARFFWALQCSVVVQAWFFVGPCSVLWWFRPGFCWALQGFACPSLGLRWPYNVLWWFRPGFCWALQVFACPRPGLSWALQCFVVVQAWFLLGPAMFCGGSGLVFVGHYRVLRGSGSFFLGTTMFCGSSGLVFCWALQCFVVVQAWFLLGPTGLRVPQPWFALALQCFVVVQAWFLLGSAVFCGGSCLVCVGPYSVFWWFRPGSSWALQRFVMVQAWFASGPAAFVTFHVWFELGTAVFCDGSGLV